MLAKDFVELGAMTSHETLRNRQKLIYIDNYADLVTTKQFIIFISHQWLGFREPDAHCQQYPVMVAAIKRVASDLKGLSDLDEALRSIYVWVE